MNFSTHSSLGKNSLPPSDFIASISFDRRLYRHDIWGSIVHVRMLARQGLIADSDAEAIIAGLESIRDEIERGEFLFKRELEDIHMNIEARLFKKVGEVAGKLHTARSRNDQVALDMRLYVRETILETINKIDDFQAVLVDIAGRNKKVVMPGYTHLQQAQPVLLAHHLLAYFEMFQRDRERLQDCLKRTNVLPLGSGALAGVPYPVDREFVARELGFSKVSANSLDAVSDRDFVIEYEAAIAVTMMHLSRLAEEVVLWSSAEFGFLSIGEEYTSGSSIMPQKKNPDVAELARGKTGRVYGNLMGILTVMKSLPLAYNRDMQEDKEGLFDSIDTLHAVLKVFTGMMPTIKFDAVRIRASINKDYVLATDLADYLVGKGVPFREAHGIIARLSEYIISKGLSFSQLSLGEYRNFSPVIEEDVYGITLESSIASRDVIGGTALRQVNIALTKARKLLKRRSYAR